MTWTADAPSGVYKDHFLSGKIRDAAIAQAQFMNFLDTEPGYGKGKGQSVTITRVHDLPLAGTVNETAELPSGRPLIDTKSVAVSEWGFKIKMTEFETHLTHFDLTNKVQKGLRDQYRLTMDKMAADALKLTPYKIIGNGASTFVEDTDGTPSTLASVNMNVTHVQKMRDVLFGTLKAPPFADGKYVLIGSTKVIRGIKSDTTNYQGWLAPTNSQPFMTGEVPSIENVRIIESNHFNALNNSIGSSGVTGEAIMFGADAGFLATVVEPELRRGIATDLGRFYDVGWYGITQAGLTWDTASRARVLHWTSQ